MATHELLKCRIVSSVTSGYSWLFERGVGQGHWNEVRSTALAGLCLSLREPIDASWSVAVREWLLSRQVDMGAGQGSWGEELWDTSMAMLALLHLGVAPKDPAIQGAVEWQWRLFGLSGNDSWHDEPWETSWCLLSGLHVQLYGGAVPWNSAAAARWLRSLQDSRGRLIAPHYTAYFVWIYEELAKQSSATLELEDAAARSTRYLQTAWNESALWSGEPWSNGQILWCLASTGRLQIDDADRVGQIVAWFLAEQDPEGGWYQDVEDTASVILGLHAVLLRLEEQSLSESYRAEEVVYDLLRRSLGTPLLIRGRKLIESHEDGTTSINLSPRSKKLLAAFLTGISVASLLVTFWEQLVSMLIPLF